MRRLLLLAIVLFAIQVPAMAQLGISFGLAGSFASPTGDWSNGVGSGIGGAALVKFGLLPIIDLTGSIDYISFTEKDAAGVKSSASTWGVNVGGRFSVLPMIYAGLELGTYPLTVKVGGQSRDTETKSAFAPIVGARFSQLDGSVRYVFMKDANFLGLRVGIWF